MSKFCGTVFRNAKFLVCRQQKRFRDGEGHIVEGGGKFADIERARENQYFIRKDQELLEYLKKEIDKGKTVTEIVEDARKSLQEGKIIDARPPKKRCKLK